jgi:hypothetical protein
MKNKPDTALLGTSYLWNEIKKDTKISWDYPFNLFWHTIYRTNCYEEPSDATKAPFIKSYVWLHKLKSENWKCHYLLF